MPEGDVIVYRARNMFAVENRDIFFFSDTPHLVKTARNCLFNSSYGNTSRCMWNNGSYMLWSHITSIYHENLNHGLKLVPKLKYEHVNLTPFSKMNVRLAAQVLSETVGKVIEHFGPPEALETSKFCIMIDKFFDCLNVSNTHEYKTKKKEFLKPYEDLNDPRFAFIDDFLAYLSEWKNSINLRPGEFTDAQKSAMFLSWQTYEGLQMTSFSLKGVVPFLLSNGFSYVLTEKFCQDDLENYFGHQRSMGRRRDNPRVFDAGYNDNTIKTQYSIKPVTGNVRGSASKWNVIDETPLKKRQKKGL